MNRTQLEHIIRAASQISGDAEIVVIGRQAVHGQRVKLPPIAFQSDEADVYPRNHSERADEIDAAIGELSPFHNTHGYYGHGVSPTTAILRPGTPSQHHAPLSGFDPLAPDPARVAGSETRRAAGGDRAARRPQHCVLPCRVAAAIGECAG